MKYISLILLFTLLNSCNKQELTVWASIPEIQGGYPWDKIIGTVNRSGMEIYLENLGIEVLETQRLESLNSGGCSGPGCATGFLIFVRITEEDILSIQKLGFNVHVSFN